MNDQYDDIILAELPDEELIEQMHDDLYDGLADEITEGTQILLDRGWEAKRVLDEALVAGMTIVGVDFRDGILFVPEVLMAANAMKAGMELLRPILADTGAKPIGKMVIGTVKGDIHDIGKNLVGMMMEGAGFEVIDGHAARGHPHDREHLDFVAVGKVHRRCYRNRGFFRVAAFRGGFEGLLLVDRFGIGRRERRLSKSGQARDQRTQLR